MVSLLLELSRPGHFSSVFLLILHFSRFVLYQKQSNSINDLNLFVFFSFPVFSSPKKASSLLITLTRPSLLPCYLCSLHFRISPNSQARSTKPTSRTEAKKEQVRKETERKNCWRETNLIRDWSKSLTTNLLLYIFCDLE